MDNIQFDENYERIYSILIIVKLLAMHTYIRIWFLCVNYLCLLGHLYITIF